MNVVLPPKRWESTESTEYDPIRHHKWFARLNTRRDKIPIVEQAYKAFMEEPDHGMQNVICHEWNIDPREFRSYVAWMSGESQVGKLPPNGQKTVRILLDSSYDHYCYMGGKISFRAAMDLICGRWTVTSRQLMELWDTDPNFYPTGYENEQKNRAQSSPRIQ